MSSDFGKNFVMARLPPLAWHQCNDQMCIIAIYSYSMACILDMHL